MSHQQSFSYKGTGLPGLNQYSARINVLAQGHNTVTPVWLEPAAPRSRVKRCTTEPLCSLKNNVDPNITVSNMFLKGYPLEAKTALKN